MKKIRKRYLFLIILISFTVTIVSGIYIYKINTCRYHANNNIYKNYTEDEDKIYSKNINYRNAVNAYEKKIFALAIEELNEEINRFSGHAQAYFLLGKIYEDVKFPEGKYYARMIPQYEKYIELKPQGKRIGYVKLRVAQYYIQMGLKQKNVALLNKAEEYLLALDKTDSTVMMALGAIYLDKENYDKAIAEFEKSANLPPAELKLKYNSLGLAYIKKGSYAKAQRFLEIAIKIDPKDKYAQNNLGFVYAQQGNLKTAKVHFNEALMIDKNYKNAAENLNWVENEIRNKK